MTSASSRPPVFEPQPPDAAGVVSWVHLGDLHMTAAREQNDLDLQRIVAELNQSFARSLSFAFLPGDVADNGAPPQYAVVRDALDRLTLPWCAIVGDHDVHGKTFSPFLESMSRNLHYTFSVGAARFFALNTFDIPDPGSFTVQPAQLQWLRDGLRFLQPGEVPVLLMHCYPTDLKSGGEELRELLQRYAVRLIDMGHTHYNEISNDGQLLYTATRSTGQIEEGPVGFSITNLDGGVVSWRFFEVEDLPAVVITSPADERLLTQHDLPGLEAAGPLRVRAKAWGCSPLVSAEGTVGGQRLTLHPVPGSQVWQAELPAGTLPDGVHPLTVEVTDSRGRRSSDTIRVVQGRAAFQPPERAARDQGNALAAWPEHGLLGTQLGPNKNGHGW